MLITVVCRADDDELAGLAWPTKLTCRPFVGDRIASMSAHPRIAVISTITHIYPILELELVSISAYMQAEAERAGRKQDDSANR